MDTILLASLNVLWIVVLVNIALTLRITHWIRATHEAQIPQQPIVRPDLVVGAQAPEFKAWTITGQVARLDDYAGRSIAFIFVSPRCGHCRIEMPMFTKLGPIAKKNAGVEMILVSYSDFAETQEWLDTMRTEDGVDVTLPVLVAPRGKSLFLEEYNPSGLWPGFCLLDEQGIVHAWGTIPSAEWHKLKRAWGGMVELSAWMLK